MKKILALSLALLSFATGAFAQPSWHSLGPGSEITTSQGAQGVWIIGGVTYAAFDTIYANLYKYQNNSWQLLLHSIDPGIIEDVFLDGPSNRLLITGMFNYLVSFNGTSDTAMGNAQIDLATGDVSRWGSGFPDYPYTFGKDIEKSGSNFLVAGVFSVIDVAGDTTNNFVMVDSVDTYHYVCKIDFQATYFNKILVDASTNEIYLAGIYLKESGNRLALKIPSSRNYFENLKFLQLKEYASKTSTVIGYPLVKVDIAGDSLSYPTSAQYTNFAYCATWYNGEIILAGGVIDTTNMSQFCIASYNVASDTYQTLAYVTGFTGEGHVKTVASFQGNLCIGGGFDGIIPLVGPTPITNRMAEFANGTWNDFGGGITNCPLPPSWICMARNFATDTNRLVAVGLFAKAGNDSTVLNIAEWSDVTTTELPEIHSSNQEFTVYPNPVSGNGELHVSGASGQVRLINCLGQVVSQQSGQKMMRLPNLPAGVYVIRSDQHSARIVVSK